MKNEIGSEFYAEKMERGSGLSLPKGAFVFSGRTAIKTILDNLHSGKRKLRALLPSYCCDSMIQPFKDSGIEVDFYKVYFEKKMVIDLPAFLDADILLWCNYFGFKIEMPNLLEFKNNGGIIIEDITHSLLSREQFHHQSDYLVASIRKWEPVLSGGYCTSLNGNLLKLPDSLPPTDFIDAKNRAMSIKAQYIYNHDESLKEIYLPLYKLCNEWLANHYEKYLIDDKSLRYIESADINGQKLVRKANANIIFAGLRECENIEPLFKQEILDCPLFVPVIINNGKRNDIRNKLIDNKIYCPVHWNRPKGCDSNIYDAELSLICDQRYSKYDIERMISVLIN